MAKLCPSCGVVMLLRPKIYHRGNNANFEVFKCPECFRTARGVKAVV